MVAAVGRHPDALFIRTLNFVSRDHRNMQAVEAQIKAMQKKVRPPLSCNDLSLAVFLSVLPLTL